MSSLLFLIPLALILGGVALGAFVWSLRNDQYDDLDGAGHRIFLDEAGDRAGAHHSMTAKPAPPRVGVADTSKDGTEGPPAE